MFDLTSAGAFEWNAQNALGLLQMLRIMPAQVAKEAVDGAQTHVARADLIAPTRFQALEKRGDLIHTQMLHGELAGVTFFSSNELQKKFNAVTVTQEGMGT